MPFVPSSAVPRPDLATCAFEFAMDPAQHGFIATRVLPPFLSNEKNGRYPFIPAAAALELLDTKRAPRSAYARGDYQFDWKAFECEEHGYEEPLDDGEASLYRNFFSAETIAAQRAMGIVLRDLEKRVADLVQNTATFADAAAAKKWDSYADADPLADVTAGKRALRSAMGVTPNALILSYGAYLDLGLCHAVIDRIKFTDPTVRLGELTTGQLAAYFGVEQVLIANGQYNAAAKGKSASIGDIWDPAKAVLARISAGGDDLREASLGRTFVWTADTPENVMIEQYREEQTRSNVYRARMHCDEVIQFAGAGYVITGVK